MIEFVEKCEKIFNIFLIALIIFIIGVQIGIHHGRELQLQDLEVKYGYQF